MNYPIPQTAARAFERAMSDKAKPRNAGLVFDRFVPEIIANDNRIRGDKDLAQRKQMGLKQVAQLMRDRDLLNAVHRRWAEVVEATEVHTDVMDFVTDWRLVTGVGRNSPYEVGFRFDRYGFATLPGSAVKGVARSYALQDLASRLGKGWQRVLPKTHRNHDGPLGQLEGLLLEETLKEFETKFPEASAEAKTIARQFRAIFGRTDEAGLAIFFDAVPKDDPKLGLDLINPHYPNYYREDGEKRNSPPTNWQSPKPVFFLALQPKVTFGFAVGWRASVEDSLRKQAKDWLAGGLTEMGLGAKTSAGYGYFVARGQGNGNRSATTPQGEQKAATGRVRYEGGKPVVVITPTQGDAIRIRVHKPWKEWGFASDVGDKTDVTIVYEETAEGKRTLISIKRK